MNVSNTMHILGQGQPAGVGNNPEFHPSRHFRPQLSRDRDGSRGRGLGPGVSPHTEPVHISGIRPTHTPLGHAHSPVKVANNKTKKP